jgi:predicted extracellular nuclease
VSEFRPGGAATNLTTTEITGPSVSVMSSGNPLPAATIITTDPSRTGMNIRHIPTDVIEDDASGSVETSGTFDPDSDGIDFYESLEGMRVEVDDAVAVGPTNNFGELPVLADNGAGSTVRTPRGGIVVRSNDFNPERIILDDSLASTPDLSVGDTIPGATIGVMDYNFGNFMLEVTQDAVGQPGGLTREVTDAPGPAHLAVATFNVQNLAPTDPQSKFDGLANAIVTNLQAPDIVAVEEIQDNTGAADDGTVDADVTYGKLIDAIAAAGGPAYQYRQINPVNDQDGGQPGGNIRVGFLFRTDRGLAFVDRGNAGPTDADSVETDASGAPILKYSPGRIDPTNPAFDDSRKPLAGEFTYHGHRLFVIANHFISKGGDDPLFGRFQPPENSSETQRHQQAQIVHDFVASILARDANADVVVLGDLNDFQFSNTLQTLDGTILHDLINTLPVSEQYTYDYEGNSEVLDHILVSDARFGPSRFQYDVVHINSEFRDQLSDHDPQVVRLLMYDFSGFFSPVDSTGLNRAKAGSALPVKWSLGPITALSSLESVQWQRVDCATGTPLGSPETAARAGGSSFRYDAQAGQFVDTLATSSSWAGTCRQVTVTLDDGTAHTSSFQFR